MRVSERELEWTTGALRDMRLLSLTTLWLEERS